MKKKTIIIVTALVLLAILGILGILAILGLLNSRIRNTEPVRLYLPENKYISYKIFCDDYGFDGAFRFMVKVSGMQGKRVRPGSYVIEPGMKNITLLRKLRNGQQDPLRLTIGKFRTPRQLNDYLNQKLMHNDFNITLDSFYLILPDTYEFYWTVTPEQFMQRMEKEYGNFKLKMKNEKCPNAAADSSFFISQFSFRDVIILASIVEEETNNNQEKPLIASVYLNRLERGMPLQADPTVKYAVATTTSPLSGGDAQRAEGLEDGFGLRRILNKHLAVESPFNTYLHVGLPPAPICLPSKTTIKAVLNAPETDYLYFCASDKMDGTHRFATTFAEHNRNAAAFHAALNRRGIK